MDIKGLVSSRVKVLKSLKEKLPDRAKKWGEEAMEAGDIHNKLHDLVGVRVAPVWVSVDARQRVPR
jgi:ppGpp synthetase/RelA/SpoT-type nucleotidyltranferase